MFPRSEMIPSVASRFEVRSESDILRYLVRPSVCPNGTARLYGLDFFQNLVLFEIGHRNRFFA